MIETLKIKLLEGLDAHYDWECVLEVPIDCSFGDLHQAILNAVGFDNEHMFEFRISSSYYSRNAQRITCDDGLDKKLLKSFYQRKKARNYFICSITEIVGYFK
tara:strand:+ start:136 stop:444 length:309 start_codon:yes stop_codon:yes gene_type:complete